MSVAVACNLSDGVILGVDSAVTVPAPGGIAKVYENAQKLFQLGERPIGVAFYGLGSIGMRSLGSFIRELEVRDPAGVISGQTQMKDVVDAIQTFFAQNYRLVIVPAIEQEVRKPFDQIPNDKKPSLGIVVGGFSAGAYLSEVWAISIPGPTGNGVAELQRASGAFGSNWFAMFEPIRRYLKGYDPIMVSEVMAYIDGLRKPPLTDAEKQMVRDILAAYEYQVPFAAMPMEEGVKFVRFLIKLVISHHRFAVGAPVVGGRVRLGKVTYRGGKFEILGDN
jgi:hypothetical protein